MNEFRLLLTEEEVEHLKILAARQRVRPQAIARDAFRAGMAARAQQPHAVPQNGDAASATDLLLSELRDVRAALRNALLLIDGVLSDGEPTADEIGEAVREVDQITGDCCDARKTGSDAAPHGVRQKPGRRAQ